MDAPDRLYAAASLKHHRDGLLLTFRNHQSHDPEWEGRKLGRQLVNDSQNHIIKCRYVANLMADERVDMKGIDAEYPIALGEHFQKPSLPHQPMNFSRKVTALMHSRQSAGRLSEFDRYDLDRHISALMEVCGACVRTCAISDSLRTGCSCVMGLSSGCCTHRFSSSNTAAGGAISRWRF